MGSFLREQSALANLNAMGVTGCNAILVADDDKIVISANMKNGAYTVAAQPLSPAKITVLATAVGTADTMGKVTIVGTDAAGNALSEEVIPVAGTTVLTTGIFASITSVTGSGWVIDGGNQNDTIKVGVNYAYPPSGHYFCAITAMADAVVASQTNVTGAYNPKLACLTKIPAGATVYGKFSSISLTSGELIGYYAKG